MPVKNRLFMIAFISLLGCENPNAVISATRADVNKQTGRIQVTSSQWFRDASGNARSILVLKDSETGNEYLAVTGCGVFALRRPKTREEY